MPRRTLLLSTLALSMIFGPLAAMAAQVQMETTAGTIVLELDEAKAPKTVDNFLTYVRDGFYDGTIFHRVIDGFMMQGGGFTADFEQKKTRAPILNEADNGLKNVTGTVAMARTRDPHSATAQFFINVADNEFLNHRGKTPRDWGYTVFGRVASGMDVVMGVVKAPTVAGGPFPKDVPQQTVTITKATVIAQP